MKRNVAKSFGEQLVFENIAEGLLNSSALPPDRAGTGRPALTVARENGSLGGDDKLNAHLVKYSARVSSRQFQRLRNEGSGQRHRRPAAFRRSSLGGNESGRARLQCGPLNLCPKKS